MNKLGVCLSHGRRDVLLKLIGGHFLDNAVVNIKKGKIFRGTGDNWDLRILKQHMRLDNQNEDFHFFASNLIENRTSFTHLPNLTQKHLAVTEIPRSKFTPNITEWKKYIETSKVLIGRIFLQFFPKFKFLENSIPKNIPHI